MKSIICLARVRTPKDKPNVEGTLGNISTTRFELADWKTATARREFPRTIDVREDSRRAVAILSSV